VIDKQTTKIPCYIGHIQLWRANSWQWNMEKSGGSDKRLKYLIKNDEYLLNFELCDHNPEILQYLHIVA